MNYYLPSTIKLLNIYDDIDEKPEIGTNIVETKKKINELLNDIGNGFEKLYDSLFEDITLDVKSDVSVIETMLLQDGLITPKENNLFGIKEKELVKA